VHEEEGKQSVASGFPGDTYSLYKNNCGANGGNHRGTRALRVTFSTKEPSPCAFTGLKKTGRVYFMTRPVFYDS